MVWHESIKAQHRCGFTHPLLTDHIDLYTTMEKLSPLLLSLLWMSWPVTSWAAQVTTDCPLHNYCDQGFTPGDNCKCYRAVDWNTQVGIKPS